MLLRYYSSSLLLLTGACCEERSLHHKYSSTFLTISRIWNGRPLTFENGTASTRYFARIIVQSWPRFISGTITVSKPARTSPRFRGKGFRCRRCADDTLFPSLCIFSTAELIEPYVEPHPSTRAFPALSPITSSSGISAAARSTFS